MIGEVSQNIASLNAFVIDVINLCHEEAHCFVYQDWSYLSIYASSLEYFQITNYYFVEMPFVSVSRKLLYEILHNRL